MWMYLIDLGKVTRGDLSVTHRHLVQAYLLLLRRTLELIPDEVMIELETDNQWSFYYRTAVELRKKLDDKPN